MSKNSPTITTNLQWAQMIALVIAEGCAVDHERLFTEAKLSINAWQSLSRVDQDDITALWRAADRLGAPPEIGLGVLKHFHFRTLGPLAFKMMVATTFRQSIIEALHQISLVSEAWRYTLTEQGNLGVMTFNLTNPRMEITHHSYDAFISACARTMQDCFPGENYRFAEIWFAHPDFGLRSKYEQLLGCPCKFNTSSYAICLESRVLDLPLASADPLLYESLDSRLKHQALNLKNLSGSIETAILSLIDRGLIPNRKTVADHLGFGERTLLRRLQDEDITYKEIQEQVFEKLALHWLKRSESMNYIAEKLGYSDAASFRKMLKRRTGLSIREIRTSFLN
ncbi:MAG: AraC family transcriptional regulator ligand-binding domain-containing protein [Zhongshania sp.]|nr:AraC family transcriptional regulator ligand-binding domain-containing protein [Zhongshania sp.]